MDNSKSYFVYKRYIKKKIKNRVNKINLCKDIIEMLKDSIKGKGPLYTFYFDEESVRYKYEEKNIKEDKRRIRFYKRKIKKYIKKTNEESYIYNYG